jgi:hypothetical protein
MGPSENHLDQVKRDAVVTTLRHFRDDAIDNGYEPKEDLDKVQAQLLKEHSPEVKNQSVDTGEGQVVSDKPAKSAKGKPAKESDKVEGNGDEAK